MSFGDSLTVTGQPALAGSFRQGLWVCGDMSGSDLLNLNAPDRG